MPFSWDSRVEEHPVGTAAMRDFQDAFGWSERNPRTPGAASARKRATPVSLHFNGLNTSGYRLSLERVPIYPTDYRHPRACACPDIYPS